jgi:hypothetical protein
MRIQQSTRAGGIPWVGCVGGACWELMLIISRLLERVLVLECVLLLECVLKLVCVLLLECVLLLHLELMLIISNRPHMSPKP